MGIGEPTILECGVNLASGLVYQSLVREVFTQVQVIGVKQTRSALFSQSDDMLVV